MNYSASCRFKPARPSFIFGTQIKIFFMKHENFLNLTAMQLKYSQTQKRSNGISKTVHVTSVVQL